VAANPNGSAVGRHFTLVVNQRPTPPAVVSQPVSLSVPAGGSAAFVATVTGAQPLNYQWQFNETDLVGANSATLILNNVTAAQAGRYRLVVRNAHGGAVTLPGTLTVTDPNVPSGPVPPVIAAHPIGVTVTEGQTAQLAVGVTGTGPLAYQWFKDAAPIAGATGAGLSFSPAAAVQAGSYTVRVSNAAGAVTSNAAALVVNLAPLPPAPLPPSITTGPVGLAVLPGAAATMAVAATGTGPLSYQWLRNGTPLAGATAPVLHLPAVSSPDAGSYSVQVSNAAGTVLSGSAQLVVIGAPVITSQPMAAQVAEGDRATFSVAAAGAGLRYQWLRDNEPIVGADQASYSPPAAAMADNGAVFRVVVFSGAGVVFSERALLTVIAKPVDPPETKIAAGFNHTCAVHGSGAVYCWGNGVNGELGYGTAEYRAMPTRVSGLLGVKAVAAGGPTSCAIDGSDALWCWGGLVDALSPVRVSAVGEVVRAVAVGVNHACYVDGGGAVRCWGGNDMGQLGDGGTDAQPNPVPVLRANGSAFTGAVALAAGNRYSCAQLGDGSVWCWGTDIALNARTAPERVVRRLPGGQTMDFTAYGRIVGGTYHACAIESGAGQPLCWGFNPSGQLGDGTTVARNEAMPAGLFGAERLVAGTAHTCAIRSLDVHCWGTAYMGNGGARQTLLGVEAGGRVGAYNGGADPVLAGAAGERHTCMLQASGTVQCWGWNNAGQIGNDAVTIDALVPVSTTLGAQFWGP
jgi:alpha-tubulin suppressor-like RCC1 family protein